MLLFPPNIKKRTEADIGNTFELTRAATFKNFWKPIIFVNFLIALQLPIPLSF